MWEQLIAAIEADNTEEAIELINQMSQAELSQASDGAKTAFTSEEDIMERVRIAQDAGDQEKLIELCAEMMGEMVIEGNRHTGTALHLAAYRDHKEVCELLIQKMSNDSTNSVDRHGNTALHWAAKRGLKEICDLLIQKMSTEAIDKVNSDGNTALHLAIWVGCKEISELLIQEMSIEAISGINESGETALHFAIIQGWKEIYEWMIQEMSPKAINSVNGTGKTALHLAANGKHQEMAEMLIEKMGLEEISKYTNDLAIQTVMSKMVVNFITQKDFTEPPTPDDFFKLALYQLVEPALLKLELVGNDAESLLLNSEPESVDNDTESLLIKLDSIDNYMATYYFQLLRVCKDTHPIKELPLEINKLIFHFAQCEFGYGVDSAGDANVVGDADLASDHPL